MKKIHKIFLALLILSATRLLLSQLHSYDIQIFIQTNLTTIKIFFLSLISLGFIHLNEVITDYCKGGKKVIFLTTNIAIFGIVLTSIILQ